jgi:hypothetical protein
VSCILRLPQDLRNHIYAFCVQGSYDNEVIVRRIPRKENTFKLLVREPFGLRSYQWVDEPIASRLNLSSVGPQVARELLESYYATRTFKFSQDGLQLLPLFLQTDAFSLGVIPANHAQHLQIHIQPFAYALLDEPASRMWEETKCLKAIEGLVTIQTARLEYHIDVELAQESLDDVDYEHLCNDVGHFLLGLVYVTEKLKEQGLCIKTTISGAWDEKRRRQLHRKFLCSLGPKTISNQEIEDSYTRKSLLQGK